MSWGEVSVLVLAIAVAGLGIALRQNGRLRHAHRALWRVIDAAPTGMIMIDPRGAITMINRQIEVMFDYPRDALIGRPVETLIPERLRTAHVGHRAHFFATPSARPMGAGRELFGRRRDGSEVPVEIGLNPIVTPHGTAVLASVVDISERHRMTERLAQERRNLEQANLELDSFVSTVSHDLRAPLRAISAYATFLVEDCEPQLGAVGTGHLRDLQRNISRMSTLIDDLLELCRLSRVRHPYADVDLGALLTDALARVTSAYDTATVEWVYPSHFPTVRCDRIKMGLVLVNLLSNAVKFSARALPHPRIELGWQDQGATIDFFIADNGIGIDPADHARIFEVCAMCHPREQYDGNGIGLSIVHRVIQEHGGRISVTSTPGHGAAFHWTLPRTQEPS